MSLRGAKRRGNLPEGIPYKRSVRRISRKGYLISEVCDVCAYSFSMYVIVIENVPETLFPSVVIERYVRLYDLTRAIASVTL